MTDAVILDFDGCLVNDETIVHLVDPDHPHYPGTKDLDAFHAASVWCPPIHSTVDWAKAHAQKGRALLILTGRTEHNRGITAGWLEGLLEVDEIHMRPEGDRRPAAAFKASKLRRLRRRYNIVAAADDDPTVLSMYRMEGIPEVLKVGNRL